MITYKNDMVEPYDVDETLVIHNYVPSGVDILLGTPPLNTVKVYDESLSSYVTLGINENMVKLLKGSRDRGALVIVWSRGGYKWAEAVIKALDLEYYVDVVLAKPRVYFDDKDVSEWLKDRVYIGPNEKYKQP